MLHHKIHKHLKRKIHTNRWLIWTIVLSILATVGLVSYIEISNIGFDREVVGYENPDTWQNYRDRALGFSLRFPPSWTIEADKDSVVFANADSGNDLTIAVSEPAAEKAIRKFLNIVKEERTTVNGFYAVKIRNEIAPGAFETVVLAKVNNRLYKISGFGPDFETVVSTIKFLEL